MVKRSILNGKCILYVRNRVFFKFQAESCYQVCLQLKVKLTHLLCEEISMDTTKNANDIKYTNLTKFLYLFCLACVVFP